VCLCVCVVCVCVVCVWCVCGWVCMFGVCVCVHTHTHTHSRFSFYDGVFRRFTFMILVQSDRALPTLVHHCHNASILSLLRLLPAFFQCACVSSFSILVQFFYVDCDFSTHDIHQKDRKEENTKTFDVTFCLDVF